MTDKQRVHLMAELWPQACAVQGWNKSDRALRLAVFAQGLDRPIESANEINETHDFDRLKKFLRTKAQNLDAAMETPGAGEARRTMHHVRQLLAELEELHPAPGAYVETLIRGIKHGARVEIGGVEDLGTEPRLLDDGRELISELEQFRRTLHGRIHGKKGMLARVNQPEGQPF